MFDLTGKAALVTGASGGIGGAIARALHGQGAAVALSGTRVAPLEALAGELGGRAHVLPCDLSDAAAVEALPKQAAEALGQVDILVNNAGITRDQLFMRMSDADWDAVIAVNLTSVMRLSRGVLRGMMKARWGRIVNVSSVVGVTGNPGQANYAASKAGVIGMSKSLAPEVASRGITVNCVAPGFIATAMTGGAERRAEGADQRQDPGRADGDGGGDRGGGGVSRLGRGRLRDRADAARERRNGDDLSARGSVSNCICQPPRLCYSARNSRSGVEFWRSGLAGRQQPAKFGQVGMNSRARKPEPEQNEELAMSDIAERVKKIVVEHLSVDEAKVTESASFIDDLGADSLDTVELVMAFEEEFGIEIPDDAAETIQTYGDAVKFIEANANA